MLCVKFGWNFWPSGSFYGQTDDGGQVIRIAHSSFQLRWAIYPLNLVRKGYIESENLNYTYIVISTASEIAILILTASVLVWTCGFLVGALYRVILPGNGGCWDLTLCRRLLEPVQCYSVPPQTLPWGHLTFSVFRTAVFTITAAYSLKYTIWKLSYMRTHINFIQAGTQWCFKIHLFYDKHI